MSALTRTLLVLILLVIGSCTGVPAQSDFVRGLEQAEAGLADIFDPHGWEAPRVVDFCTRRCYLVIP